MGALKSIRDIEDFVRGCTFFGTGGGGPPEAGIRWLSELLDEGKELAWVPADEVSDDVWTVCCYLMGSIAPQTDEITRTKKGFGLTKRTIDHMAAEAGRELSRYANATLAALVPLEIGGAATPSALAAGAVFGVPVVDGDYSGGRAIPEVPQTTPIIYKQPMWPMASVDAYGNKAIIADASSYEMAERIGKKLSEASFDIVGNAAFLLRGKVMKKTVVKGTLTNSLKVGRAIREARDQGKDPVEAAREAANGWILFEGKVSGKDWEDKEGYLWGTHTITGAGDFNGQEFKIWFKNENHVTWLNGNPYVTSPDTVVVVDLKTAEPKTNTVIKEGDEVAVIGIEAAEAFTTEKGIEILGPKHFEFDLKYKPIAQCMR